MSVRLLSLCLTGVVGWSCTSSDPRPAHTVRGCAPYASNQCLTPFPNAWFQEPGQPTATGFRVKFDPAVMPVESNGVSIDANFMGHIDGFSPATPLVAWFPNGVDATQLTPSVLSPIDDRIAFMSTDTSPIALVDVAARKRIPIFAELDANAFPDAGEKQALVIHPAIRLDFARRYAVAITTALRDAKGNPLAAEGQFARWKDGTLKNDEALAEVADRLDEDAAAFAALGIPKSSLALAWDFDTASEASTTGQLEDMMQQAFAAGPDGFGFKIGKVTDKTVEQDKDAARIINGTFKSPSFETGADPSPLAIDANGRAIMGQPVDWKFTAVVSQCAAKATGPVPLVVIGHGIFGEAEEELPNAADHLQALCAVGIGADWVGLAKNDVSTLTQILGDPNLFGLVTGRLEQAHLNFQVLTRMAVKQLSADPALTFDGHAIITADSPVYYWGQSNGGIQGGTFLALSAEAKRGVLIVPGAVWSELMWRSGDFSTMLVVLQTVIPDKLQLQVLLTMTQSLWDKTDPIQFAPKLAKTNRDVLFQESVGDPVVSNVATRTQMRTLGAKAMGHLIEPVYGLTAQPGPLNGLVYTQWSMNPTPMPPYENIPGPVQNGAHNAFAHMPKGAEQGVEFLLTGQATDHCGGEPCVFPKEK